MIEAILFDVGRTLYVGKGRRHVAPAYTRAACEQLGVAHQHLSDAQITDAYLETTAAVRARHADTYFRKGGPGPDRTLWLEHNAEVVARLGFTKHPGLAAAIEQQWEGWAPVLCPQPQCAEVLETLRARGYRLGVLSNTFRDHRERFEADGLTKFFEVCVLSSETNLWKPEPAAFVDACARMGVAPQHTAYIGDKWEIDVVPALALGMFPVFFETPDRVPDDVPPGVAVIHAFTSLLDLFPKLPQTPLDRK